ncbi:MAG: glutaredoxin 3 [Gammaproteobacteria bacterium]|nr:glutaredoxin 3 [Gammaproteobacteria bacterium]
MTEIVIYGTQTCPYCARARRLLDRKGVKYIEVRVYLDISRRREMETRAGRNSVPQIFIGDLHVGGFDDLSALDQEGNLDALLGLSAQAK